MLTHTQIDQGSVLLRDGVFRDELLTLAGADELKAGTILARSTSTLKLVIFVKGGSTNGNGVPAAVLTAPVSASGAGDVPVRVLIRGIVDPKRLVIDADGDADNVDGAVIDQLRDLGITPEEVKQLGKVDNA